MKNIILTGSSGFIGKNIYNYLSETNNILQIDRSLIDNPEYIHSLQLFSPEIMIYAAGEKSIDFCEKNRLLAKEANLNYLKKVSKIFPNLYIIYFSTDYVFDGIDGNYSKNDKINPITVYGETKGLAEKYLVENFRQSSLILRSAAIFSKDSLFVKNIIEHCESNIQIRLCEDSLFSPTPLNLILKFIEYFLENQLFGIHHVSGLRQSRFNFASNIARIFNLSLNYELVSRDQINHNLMPDLSLINSFLESHWKEVLPSDLYDLNLKNASKEFEIGDFYEF